MYTAHTVELKLESYVAQPYWPEANAVIDIQKKSGMNFARTDAKRDQTLAAYLDKVHVTREEYDLLVLKAARPWYRKNPDDPESEIIIPRHQVQGCLVETCNRSPASVIQTKLSDSLRTLIRVTDFLTGKTTHDEEWDRYIKNEASNQRRFQHDIVLKDVTVQGIMTFDPDIVKVQTVEALLKYAMTFVGIGGARKMGYGRGKLISIKQTDRTMESPIDAPTEADLELIAELVMTAREMSGLPPLEKKRRAAKKPEAE